jgi:hypothetical protein
MSRVQPRFCFTCTSVQFPEWDEKTAHLVCPTGHRVPVRLEDLDAYGLALAPRVVAAIEEADAAIRGVASSPAGGPIDPEAFFAQAADAAEALAAVGTAMQRAGGWSPLMAAYGEARALVERGRAAALVVAAAAPAGAA